MGNDVVRRKGPELDPRICSWLDEGGPFPSILRVSVPGLGNLSQIHEFEILDRNSNGQIEHLKGGRRGKKGFVLRVRYPGGHQEFAAKLCIPSDYNDAVHVQAEVGYSARLRDVSEYIHLVDRVGRVDPFANQPATEDGRPWVCFISNWLPGRTLEDYLEKSPQLITPALVVIISESLLRAVLLLEKKGLKHDDLHLGNMMLVPATKDLLAIDPEAPEYQLKLIDLGSLKHLDRPTFKEDDDWSSVAKCVAQLHNALHQDRAIASRYPRFLQKLSAFVRDLADEDLSRHFPEDSIYLARIRDAARTLTFFPPSTAQFHPFEAISAEHLASDALLLKLFVDHLPWITIVQSPEPSVLIGPRGCGKSMVFRYLSARTHISSPVSSPDFLEKLGFFGIYIGCASDLGNDLLWIAREIGRPKRLADRITSYFNLVLTRELLRTLATCARTSAIAAAIGLGIQGSLKIVSFIKEQLGDHLDVVRLQGMDPLQICADAIDKLRLRLGQQMLEDKRTKIVLPATFMRELCRTVVNAVPGLGMWRIVFLLDDYTAHRLSIPVQTVLNGVVWQRDASYTFKVSSEPHGFDAGHVDGARIDANREYTPVDAGELTINAKEDAERRKFVVQLLDKRLEAANYDGRVHELIGESEHRTDVRLADAIRSFGRKRVGQRYYYSGLQILSNAWSGDIATVLHMVREMFARSNVTKGTVTQIPAHIQHQSIVRVSTALRDRISGYHPFGSEMSKVLASFGDVARRLLIEAPDYTDRNGDPAIHRKYRLEMTLPAGVEVESEIRKLPNGDSVVSLMRELVRRAIFIQLPASRGKEDAARRTLRWQLRSSLLPSFGTSLVRKHYIDVKRIEDFVEMLTNSEMFAQRVYARYSNARRNDLFEDFLVEPEEDDE